MPCIDAGRAEEEAHKDLQRIKRSMQDTYARLDTVTAMLCETLKSLSPEQIEKLPLATRQWWAHHQAFDRSQGR